MSERRRRRISDLAEDDEGTGSSVSVDEDANTSKFQVHIMVQPQGKECATEIRVIGGGMLNKKHTSRLPPINKTDAVRGPTTSISYTRQYPWQISHRSKMSDLKPVPRVLSSRYHAGCCPPDMPRLSLPPPKSPKNPSWSPRNILSPTDQRKKRLQPASEIKAGQIAEYLHKHPDFLDRFVMEEVEQATLERWRTRSTWKGMKVPISHMAGRKTSLSRWKFVHADKRKMLQDLTNTLQTHPTRPEVLWELASCISSAVNADGFDLFAVDPEDHGQLLLILGTEDLSEDGHMKLRATHCESHPLSVPIYVARTKLPVRTSLLEYDERFRDGVAHSLDAVYVLCQAITQADGTIVGVLDLWRNENSSAFCQDEEDISQSYLVWGEIALHYCNLYSEMSTQTHLTAFILAVAKSIFQDMVAMDQLMRKVMTFAQKLVNADRASLFLVDQKTKELYATIFDVGIEAGQAKENPDPAESSEKRNNTADSISASASELSTYMSGTGSETALLSDNSAYTNTENMESSADPRVITDPGPSVPKTPTSEKNSSSEESGPKSNPSKEIRFPVGTGIAGHVAKTGEVLNIKDAYADPRFNRTVDQLTGYRTETILCMPIYIRGDIIGVVQMVNKHSGFFTKEDETAFEMFAVYCGLALHHAKLYDKIKRSEQKYKVALEVLSYHNTCTEEEVDIALGGLNPANIIGVDNYYFSPFNLEDFEKASHAIYMFTDLFGLTRFDRHSLVKFTLTVKKNYRRVPYHNWTHGFSVANCMYAILKRCNEVFTPNESLALYIGSLCHDLDHRGKNNKFMLETESPLAAIYSTSTMEHHHFNQTVTILQQEGHNIFSKLSNHDYKEVLGFLKHCILATDLALFFGNRAKLSQLVSQQDFSWSERDHRLLIQAIAMTASDLSASAKPWDIQVKTVSVIFEEFYEQGDAERKAGRTPIPMMDRQMPDEQPASQVGFLTGICIPCYSLLNTLIPETRPLLDMCQQNLSKWRKIDQKIRNKAAEDESEEDPVVCANDAAGAIKDLAKPDENILTKTPLID